MLFFLVLTLGLLGGAESRAEELSDADRVAAIHEILSTHPSQVQENTQFGVFEFDKNTEIYVRKMIDLPNGDHAVYGQILRGNQKGANLWTVVSDNGSPFVYYKVTDSLALQTLKLSDAHFLKAGRNFKAYLDYKGIISNLSQLNEAEKGATQCYEEMTDLTKHFPVSGPRIPATASEKLAIKDDPCPEIPKTRGGKNCKRTSLVDLKNAKKLKSYIRASAQENHIDPALIASILAQESMFNPLIENLEEKSSCENSKNKSVSIRCSKYGWSKGMAQIGSIIAKQYGLDWNPDVPRIRECEKNPLADSCYDALETHCDELNRQNGKYPVYCPKQAISVLGQYLSDMANRERKMRVMVKEKGGNFTESVIDLKYTINDNPANLFRYIAGDYNRGPRVDNSIEEHFRQFGKQPKNFGNAWATLRVPEETPSKAMGYRILNQEYINRCYVWNIAGLCGKEFPPESLAAYYRKQFRDKQGKSK